MRAHLAAISEMAVPASARTAFYVALFLLIWQAACSVGLVSPIILASPLSIVLAVRTSGLDYLSAIPFTLFEIVVGIGAAWFLGVGVGLLIGTSRLLSVAIAPILSAIFRIETASIPSVTNNSRAASSILALKSSCCCLRRVADFIPRSLSVNAVILVNGVRRVKRLFLRIWISRSIGGARPRARCLRGKN